MNQCVPVHLALRGKSVKARAEVGGHLNKDFGHWLITTSIMPALRATATGDTRRC